MTRTQNYFVTSLARGRGDEIIRISGMKTAEANALLSIMELKDLIREELGEIRKN